MKSITVTNNKYLNKTHSSYLTADVNAKCCNVCVCTAAVQRRGVQRTGVDTSEDGDYSAGPTAPPPVDGDTDILME